MSLNSNQPTITQMSAGEQGIYRQHTAQHFTCDIDKITVTYTNGTKL